MKGCEVVTRCPRRISSAWLPLVLGSLLLACGSSPTPRFYALTPLADDSTETRESQLGIGVGPVHVPRYLQRPQIVRRRGVSGLDYDEMNRWGGSLESEILRVVGENLAILLDTDRVMVYPLLAPFPKQYDIRLDVERFDGEPGGDFVTKVRWAIVPKGSRDSTVVEVTNLTEPLESSSIDALVRAHGQALAELSRRIASRLKDLESATPPEE
jgi:uncharacterized lipoprotein YmbA